MTDNELIKTLEEKLVKRDSEILALKNKIADLVEIQFFGDVLEGMNQIRELVMGWVSEESIEEIREIADKFTWKRR